MRAEPSRHAQLAGDAWRIACWSWQHPRRARNGAPENATSRALQIRQPEEEVACRGFRFRCHLDDTRVFHLGGASRRGQFEHLLTDRIGVRRVGEDGGHDAAPWPHGTYNNSGIRCWHCEPSAAQIGVSARPSPGWSGPVYRLGPERGGGSVGNTSDFFTLAQRRAQSELKHAILESYLAAFAGKVGSKSAGGKVGYLDGYAGPGTYTHSGTGLTVDGSPAIALRVADHLREKVKPPKDLRCVFIEPKKKYFSELEQLVAGTSAVPLRGTVDARLSDALAYFANMPALVFLDPFGVGLDRASCLRQVLQRSPDQPTELLLNFSLEAVRRVGPFVRKPEGTPNRAALLETMDTWLGGDWWHPHMAGVNPADPEATNNAANAIAHEYGRRLSLAAQCGVATVPMRRSAAEKPLFSLMLFHPKVYAKYPFNEAVSNAQKKWRDRMWDLDVQRAVAELDRNPLLGKQHVDMVLEARKYDDNRLVDEWVDTIYENINRALDRRPSLTMKDDFDIIFDGVVGAARGTHFRKAWDRLHKDGLATKCENARYEWAVIARPRPTFAYSESF